MNDDHKKPYYDYLEIEFRKPRRRKRPFELAAPTRELHWSSNDLLSMLRKRLHIAEGFEAGTHRAGSARFPEAVDKRISLLASELGCLDEIPFDGAAYAADLFLEVLRHTFWRPREVLIHYAEILAVAMQNRDVGRPTRRSSIRAVIARTNHIIIEDEWLYEIREHIPNIDEIIWNFQQGNQQLEYGEASDRLSRQSFEFTNREIDFADRGKLPLLYKLGFFGVRRKLRQSKNCPEPRDRFYHIDPKAADFGDVDFQRSCWLVIHPLFLGELKLIPNVGEPVMNFTWSSKLGVQSFTCT